MAVSYSHVTMQEAYNEEPETGGGRRARAVYDYQAGLLEHSMHPWWHINHGSIDAKIMTFVSHWHHAYEA